jgi:hypothetical protein
LNAGVAFTQLPVEQELGVAVEHEEIGAHLRGELRSRDVVPDVGVAHARRDADGARARRQQRRLGHAPAAALLDADGRAVGVVEGEVLERVVADAVAHRVIEGNRLFALAFPLSALWKKRYGRVIAVDEAPGVRYSLICRAS